MRLLGSGGMGAVYQAWDQELNVVVALKVIRPEISAHPTLGAETARRFKRELLLAREVTHKNVVRIHDLGEVEGIKYITMAYVEGIDLAGILRKERKLSVVRALEIARNVAAGLEAAHDAGVVHRDLKPANIMVDAEEDCAQIMDFGIARSTARSGPDQGGGALSNAMASQWRRNFSETMPGTVVGTIEYMAPEQAKGQPVDHRADIYAFGLILYDMLLGRRLVRDTQTTAFDDLTRRMTTAPAPARSIDPKIPEALDRVITRCLHPEAAERYQTTGALVADLHRLDAEGNPIPVLKRFTKLQLSVAAAALLTLLGGTWWAARGPAPVVERPPMSVLVADFQNQTNDPAFQGALEDALSVAVEGASFINAYPRRDAQRVATQLKPGSTLDEPAARLVSGREGIAVVLAGTIAPRGDGYAITVRAIDPAAEKPLATRSANADNKGEVLQVVTSLAERIRRDLGDTSSENTGTGARESLSAASLDAARAYAVARELELSYKDEEAIGNYKAAVAVDPNFGRAYAGWGNSAFRLGREEESKQAWNKALSLIDRMTDREKFRTLGVYYGTVSRNYAKAIETYEQLVKQYPADGAAHNNLALAYFNVRDFPKALAEGRRLLDIYPNRLLYQGNYALYAMYTGDFTAASAQAGEIIKSNPGYYPAYLPLAVSALANGNPNEARDMYTRMSAAGAPGASIAAMGIADIALFGGRSAEALEALGPGIDRDRERRNAAGLAAKEVAQAEAHLAAGNTARAMEAIRRALGTSRDDAIAVPAARMFVQARRSADAGRIAEEFAGQLQPQRRAYAKLIEGEIALAAGRAVDAIEAFSAGIKLADLWLLRFALGVAYVQANQFPEALSELEACQKRRGEATAIFLDDVPTYRYLAPLPYWLGRAHEGVGARPAAERDYTAYVNSRTATARDPLLIDARRRLSAQ